MRRVQLPATRESNRDRRKRNWTAMFAGRIPTLPPRSSDHRPHWEARTNRKTVWLKHPSSISETRDAAIYLHERNQPLLRLAHQPGVTRVTFNDHTRLSEATGMVKKKVEPCPCTDSAQIRPPERSTIRLQVASPMPLPLLFVPWRRLKGSKMADACTASNFCCLFFTSVVVVVLFCVV